MREELSNMKNWEKPELTTLEIVCTEQGKDISSKFDEIRVDQNGNYWAGFSSGIDSKPDIDGKLEIK